VDFEIPKWLAAERTVAPFSMMYTASSQALSSMVSAIVTPPMLCSAKRIYVLKGVTMPYFKKFKTFSISLDFCQEFRYNDKELKGGVCLNIRIKTLRNIFLGVAASILLYWLLFDTDRVKLVFNFLKTLFAPFALGAGLAFIVNVPMSAIENKLKGIKKNTLRRVIALLLTFIAVALILFLVVRLLLPQIVETVETLISRLPAFYNRTVELVNEFLEKNPELMEWVEANTDFEQMDLMAWFEKMVTWIGNRIATILGGAFSAIGTVFSTVFNGVISFVFALYCLFRKEILARQGRRLLYALLP
jgi:hypothetical protein